MPAGGFKVFVDGEVLPASDINDYLMQGILVFSSEANRDAAIAGPDHGMFAFTTDNDRLWYYDGANWVEFTPDVEFASTTARDAGIPSPVDGRYAYTTDFGRVWKYDAGSTAWVQLNAPRSADFSNAATGTYTDGGGLAYKYVTFTSNGTLTITRQGFADILVVGGGGGGGFYGTAQAGGGAGGVRWGTFELAATTYSVTVGSGSVGVTSGTAATGGSSGVAGVLLVGGGAGAREGTISNPSVGANGVGGGGSPGAVAQGGQTGFHEGGGAGGTVYGSTQRDGIANDYTGTSVTYGTGGPSTTGAGAANTGNGGGAGSAGGSGVVVVRVRTN